MVYHPFRHLGLKFLSIAVAFGLWFAVAGEQTVERSLRVPLEVTGRPDHLVQVENPPDQVDVRMRGASGLLNTLSADKVVAIVNLSAATEGQRFFYLTPGQIRAPFGVEVVEVTPSTVSIRFEKSMTKIVPVKPVVEGEPATGFVAGKASVEPATVEVTGPESAMKRLEEATTEPVSLTGRRSLVSESVTIAVFDSSLRLKAPVTATVTVPVEPEPIDRRVEQVPVRVRNLDRGRSAQVVPDTVAVAVRGPKDVVEGLRPDSVSAFVDLAGRGPGRWYNLPVRVEPTQDFVVVRSQPATVQVRIR